jgi:uncharacterized membrane protein YkvI
MPPFLSRLAYICEFLLALLTITVVWSAVGGQEHLDLMPWYDKLTLTFALTLTTVLGTMAAVSHERAWNGRVIASLIVALLIASAMGVVTYYYHLHEDDDNANDDGNGVAALMMRATDRNS